MAVEGRHYPDRATKQRRTGPQHRERREECRPTKREQETFDGSRVFRKYVINFATRRKEMKALLHQGNWKESKAVVPKRWFVTPLGVTEPFCGGSDGLPIY